MHSRSFRKVVIVTISLQNFMKLAIFNLHMLYFQCVKGIKETQKMSSINAIGSQVNFTGAKKSSKNADKQNIKELGGRSFEEKYKTEDGKPVNVTTANLGILGGDFILDHAIEIGLAAVTFVALALKGKSLMNGVTGGIVDTTKQMADKNGDKLGITKKLSTYIESTIENIKKTKSLRKQDANNLKNNAEGFIKENAKKTVIENSIIDRLAKKADNPDSLFSKFVKKISKNPDAGSDDVRNFFAKKFGITRGADIVDNAAVLGIAGGASGIVHSITDVVTDLNDEDVAKRAQEANRRYQEAETKAEKKAIKKEQFQKRIDKIGKAAEQMSEII